MISRTEGGSRIFDSGSSFSKYSHPETLMNASRERNSAATVRNLVMSRPPGENAPQSKRDYGNKCILNPPAQALSPGTGTPDTAKLQCP
jgi:hypothetical protein